MIPAIAFILAIVAYSISQLQQHGKLRWNKNQYGFWGIHSWANKYAQHNVEPKNLISSPENWYYRLFKLKYKERFPLSATFLVAFTDGYHASQSLSFILLALGISLLSGWSFLLCWLGIVGVHALTYRILSK